MIRIVSGPIDGGKTARMEKLSKACPPGTAAGFISRKLYVGGEFTGYELYSLADGHTALLAMLESRYDGRFEHCFKFDRFVFAPAGFEFGTAIIAGLLAEGFTGEIFIDEIGPLELQGQGFAPILRQALQRGAELTISVRDNCREAVLAGFDIRHYRLIEVPDGIQDEIC